MHPNDCPPPILDTSTPQPIPPLLSLDYLP